MASYFIFKSMEQGATFRISVPKYPTQDPNHRILARQRSRFTHYYFYIRDEVLGPIVAEDATHPQPGSWAPEMELWSGLRHRCYGEAAGEPKSPFLWPPRQRPTRQIPFAQQSVRFLKCRIANCLGAAKFYGEIVHDRFVR